MKYQIYPIHRPTHMFQFKGDLWGTPFLRLMKPPLSATADQFSLHEPRGSETTLRFRLMNSVVTVQARLNENLHTAVLIVVVVVVVLAELALAELDWVWRETGESRTELGVISPFSYWVEQLVLAWTLQEREQKRNGCCRLRLHLMQKLPESLKGRDIDLSVKNTTFALFVVYGYRKVIIFFFQKIIHN